MLRNGSWSFPQTNSIRKRLRVKGASSSIKSVSDKTNVKSYIFITKNNFE